MKLSASFSVIFLLLYVDRGLSKHQPSIIIVGAGPAGVAAGTRLLEHGFTNLKILEAEPRIGGRINSVFFGDAYIDLGAEWCHGEKDNIVYDMVKDLDLLKHTEFTRKIYHSSKKNLDEEFQNEFMDVIETLYEPDGKRDDSEGVTLGHHLIEKYNESIYEKFRNNPERLELAKESMALFHHMVLSSEGAFSWFDPSADSDYRACEGDLNLNWKGSGFKTILEVLMKKFPDPSKQLPFEEKVSLNKEVVKVFWNDKVSVICSDGSVFEADHIIFTPSIGVLKERHERIFTPSLPNEKKEAIKQIGFGAVMKVAMHFKERWWGSNFTGFMLTWSEDDKNKVSAEFPEGPLKEGRSWLTEIFSVIPPENNPNVLVAWITGKMIPQIELMANETISDGIEFVLNKFVGHKYNVTAPDSIIRSTWYTNPHFRGTYSFQTLEARKNNVSAEMELAKPLLNSEGRPVVMFAGEASHPYFYSTVHGAIETGYREADRIINSYK